MKKFFDDTYEFDYEEDTNQFRGMPPHLLALFMTPMQRGVVGATNLNLALQEALNPTEHEIFMRDRGAVMMPKETLRRSGYAFRAEDKVMQINSKLGSNG